MRQQYEENPYPRWVKAGPPGQPRHPKRAPARGRVADVLIAGCGTGLSTIEFARQARARAHSRNRSEPRQPQLRQAHGAELRPHQHRIRTGRHHEAWPRSGEQFDFIDASGVLHHLADPWEGWRMLLSLLRPGGVMQVGLYSELARQNVVAARALIAERGYRPIPQDIRRCREDIVAAADGSLLKSLIQCGRLFHDQRMPRSVVSRAGASA